MPLRAPESPLPQAERGVPLLLQLAFTGRSVGRRACCNKRKPVGEASSSLKGIWSYCKPPPHLCPPCFSPLSRRGSSRRSTLAHKCCARLRLHGFDHDFIAPSVEPLKSPPAGSPLLPTYVAGSSTLHVNGSRIRCLCSRFSEEYVWLYKCLFYRILLGRYWAAATPAQPHS